MCKCEFAYIVELAWIWARASSAAKADFVHGREKAGSAAISMGFAARSSERCESRLFQEQA